MDRVCIIVGNGPSLRDVPLRCLSAYDTFGTNKIFLLQGFTPTYYVAVNTDLEPFVDEINKMECVKYISDKFHAKVRGALPIHSMGNKQFVDLPSIDRKLWEGYGVTYCCLQIAYWLNYDTALLVGVDHRYNNEQTHGNHFSDEYEDGIPVITHQMEKLEPAYILARDAYARAGRKIINLTPNTALDIFEKGSISEWMR